MANHYNLIVQTLSDLSFVMKIDALLASMYMYFVHLKKRYLEHTKLIENHEASSKCVLLKYKLLVVKMNEDNMWNSLTKTNYELLCECDIFRSDMYFTHVGVSEKNVKDA